MTTAEYTAQSRQMTKDQAQQSKELAAVESVKANSNAKGSEAQPQDLNQDSEIISALNLRMLQGAFIALGVGSLAAGGLTKRIKASMEPRWIRRKRRLGPR